MNKSEHSGTPIVRVIGSGRKAFVSILCSEGHSVDYCMLKDWAGSALEGRFGRQDTVITCNGRES